MKRCPRCKQDTLHPEPVRNSLSRRDSKAYICNPCGDEEAMIDEGYQRATLEEVAFVQKLEAGR